MSVLDYKVWDGTQWVSACDENVSIQSASTNSFDRIEQNARVWTGSQWDVLSCCECPEPFNYAESTADCSTAFTVTGETALIVWHDTSGSFDATALFNAAATAAQWAEDNNIGKVIQIDRSDEDYLLWFVDTLRVAQSSIDNWNSNFSPNERVRWDSTLQFGNSGLFFVQPPNSPTAINNFIVVFNINENDNDYGPTLTSIARSHYSTAVAAYNERARNFKGLLYDVSGFDGGSSQFQLFRLHCIAAATGFVTDAEIANNISDPNDQSLTISSRNALVSTNQSAWDTFFTANNFPTLEEMNVSINVDNDSIFVFSNGTFYSDLDQALLQVGNSTLPQNVPCGTPCVCRTGYTYDPQGNPLVDACVNDNNSNIKEPCQASL